MVNRLLNGLPAFDNPFAAKPDRFAVWGFRKMALGVLIVSLEELMWDPATGRSPQERAQMLRAKEEAGPWFESDAFEAFASMAQLPISNETLRTRCLTQPAQMLQDLRQLRLAMDEQRVSEKQRLDAARQNEAMRPRNLPANNWVFGDMIESLSESVRGAMDRARDGAKAAVKQGPLFDEVATAEERVAWANVAREPVRHRVGA